LSKITGVPYAGPLEFSLADVKEILIDLPDNTPRLRTEMGGLPRVLDELATSVPAHGEAAGVPAKLHEGIVNDTADIEALDKHEEELEKALEVVKESRAKKVHDRENKISMLVDSVKSTAHRTGDNAILAPFERTIQYNSQIAEKAAKTRRKNAEAAAAAENTDEGATR